MSIRRAAFLYCVPKSTQADYASTSNPSKLSKLKQIGPETNWDPEIETILVKLVADLPEIGFPIGMIEFLDVVAGNLKNSGQDHLSKGGGISFTWNYSFIGMKI